MRAAHHEERMRKLAWSAVLFVAIAAATSAVVRGTSTTQAETANSNAQVVRVTRRDIGTIVKATGVIKPRVGAEVKVGSRISGVVDHLYVQVGDAVAKGQLLAALDDRDLVAKRDEAAATLRQAEADWQYLTADLRRKSTLGASGNIASAELELAASGVEVAKQKVEGARASLAFAAAQVGYARIVAPIGGVVASVSTQEGETVAASFAAPTFLTLLDPSRLEVWSYVDETDIGRIRSGQTARFTVDTYGDHEFDGRVTTVYPKAEIRDNVVNYVTVVRFEPLRDRTLRSEMTTTVRIALELREHALAVPIRAVRWQDKRAFVLSPKGERRWVTTGMKDDTHVEIIDGLREGDEVLIGDPTPKGESKS
jgi:RND family efflux transporter MFP subunit